MRRGRSPIISVRHAVNSALLERSLKWCTEGNEWIPCTSRFISHFQRLFFLHSLPSLCRVSLFKSCLEYATRKVLSVRRTQKAEMMMINLSRGYMLSGLFSLKGSLNCWIFSLTQRTFFVPLFTHLSVSFLPWLNLIPDLSSLSLFSCR